MLSDHFTQALLWEQAICLDCDTAFDVESAPATLTCPCCDSDAVFLARDLERIEAWLLTLGDAL